MLGSYLAGLQWQGKTSSQQLYIIKSLSVTLLRLSAIEALKVVRFLGVVEDPETTLHAKLFRELGTLKDKHHLPSTRHRAILTQCTSPDSYPAERGHQARAREVRDNRLIRHVSKPTPWCSGLVAVLKLTGAYWLCVNLTRLNEVVLRESQILQAINQVLGLLGNVAVFSRLDATLRFHQVRLAADPESRL